jgi:hypothetical protein
MLRLSIDMRCWALLSSSGIYEKNDISEERKHFEGKLPATPGRNAFTWYYPSAFWIPRGQVSAATLGTTTSVSSTTINPSP